MERTGTGSGTGTVTATVQGFSLIVVSSESSAGPWCRANVQMDGKMEDILVDSQTHIGDWSSASGWPHELLYTMEPLELVVVVVVLVWGKKVNVA